MKTQHADLASPGRAGTFARRKARTAQRDYLRRAWRVLLGLYVGLVMTTAWPALLMPSDFLAGLVVGLSLAGSAGALVSLVIINTGTGPVMAGESAEQWTVEELKDLLEHGHRLVNHVVVDGRGDADHVLVGPAGMFVLETKWSATPFAPQDRRVGEVIDRLERRADKTRLQFKRLGVEAVTPVLVLWGPAARALAEGTGVARSGRTFVVAGLHLRRWMLARRSGQLDAPTVQRVHDELAVLARRTDAREDPVPPSVEELVQHSLSLAVVGAAAFVLPWFAAAYLHPAGFLLALALLGTGFLRDRGSWRIAVTVGAGAATLLAAGAYVVGYATALL